MEEEERQRTRRRGDRKDWRRGQREREAGVSEEGGAKVLGREGEEGEEASSHPELGEAGSSWNPTPTPMSTEGSLPP